MADAPYTMPDDNAAGGGSPYGPYQPQGADQAGAAMATRAALAAQAGIGARPEAASPGAAVNEAPQFAQEPMGNLEGMQKQGWSTKVYHGILNALGGQYDTQFIPTENGVIKNDVAKTPGQQWKTIIAGGLSGFAAAGQAGTQGPGGTMRGAAAGVAGGMKQAADVRTQNEKEANTAFQQEQQAMMSKAQRSMMNIELATKTFQLGQMQVEASVGDSQRYNQFMETAHQAEKAGGRMIGHFKTPDEAYAAFEQDSGHHESLAHGRIVTMPHVENGKINGVDALYAPDDFMNAQTTYDIPVTYKFWENGKQREVTHTIPAGAVTNGAAQDIQTKLSTMQSEDHWKEYEADFKKKELQIRGAEAQSSIEKNRAETRKTNLEADALPGGGGTGGNETDDALVDMIGQGRAGASRLYTLMTKRPDLMAKVNQKYPGFDVNQIEAYKNAYKDFTSGETNEQLLSAGAVLQHLKELVALNTKEASVYGTNDYSAYHDKANTVASELGKFYKTTTEGAVDDLKRELLSMRPSNRNIAIQQKIKSMGDRMDEYEQRWRAAAPSPAYEAEMPGISDEAKQARASIDPMYADRLKTGLPATAYKSVANAGGQPVKFSNGQTWQLKNGHVVQVPASPAGGQ